MPHDIPLADIPDRLERIRAQHILRLNGREIRFTPDRDLNIRGDQVLPKHPNGLNFTAYGKDDDKLKEQIYYSVGGGFIVTDQEFDQQAEQTRQVPYLYTSCAELLAQCRMNQLDISEAVLANEAALAGCSEAEIRRRVAGVADVMEGCIRARWRGVRNSAMRDVQGNVSWPGLGHPFSLICHRLARFLHCTGSNPIRGSAPGSAAATFRCGGGPCRVRWLRRVF